eukprot:c22558_g1_i2 orf=170-871(-)
MDLIPRPLVLAKCMSPQSNQGMLSMSRSLNFMFFLKISAKLSCYYTESPWNRCQPMGQNQICICTVNCRTFEQSRWFSCISMAGLNANMSSSGSNGDEKEGSAEVGGTLLGRFIRSFLKKLSVKISEARENFPMKALFLLLGYYSANALATLIGQTGDWDVFAVGVIVAVIEGIGLLMYRLLPLMMKLRVVIQFLNFWKLGLSLGLFLDSFKVDSYLEDTELNFWFLLVFLAF